MGLPAIDAGAFLTPPQEKYMRIVSIIARLLLGALMVFAGANHVFNFLPKGPMPPGVGGQLLAGMIGSGYMSFVGVCEVIAGLLLMVNRFAPLALTVLAAITVNIIVVNALAMPKALPVAAVVTILWILAAVPVRAAFSPLLQQRVAD
jgi:putative oxidoreductase